MLLPRLGGGPYNTAVALGRLGAPAAFCSRVSTDGFGDALLAGPRTAGIVTSLVQRGPEPTTLAVAAIGADGSAGYGFYAEGSADRLFELPPQLPDAVRALVLGACSLVLEPGAGAYEALLHSRAARDALSVDASAALGEDGWRDVLRSASRAAAVVPARHVRDRA
jgi:fructokinase